MSSLLGPKASPAKLSLLWARTQIPARKKNAHRFQMEKVRHEKRAIRAMESPRGKWGAGTTYSLGDRSPPLRTEARGARLCYQSSEFMASPTERGLNLYREDRGTAKGGTRGQRKGDKYSGFSFSMVCQYPACFHWEVRRTLTPGDWEKKPGVEVSLAIMSKARLVTDQSQQVTGTHWFHQICLCLLWILSITCIRTKLLHCSHPRTNP